jgi:hypothetical protein
MKEKNSTLIDFLQREKQVAELRHQKQLIRKYIEEVAFEQVRNATVKEKEIRSR